MVIKICPRVCLNDKEDLATYYTPGVGKIVQEIAKNREKVWEHTIKKDSVAIISNGSAVLGFGNLGPEAMLPVLEGKSLILKKFGNINAFPIAIRGNKDDLIRFAQAIVPTFAVVMIEDVKAPESFEIQETLENKIPVFNDDMYGTAVVTGAALINALDITKKSNPKIVIIGAGAAGLTVATLLHELGYDDIWIFDSKGILSPSRKDLNKYKKRVALLFNKPNVTLKEALKNADVLIGFSKGNILTSRDISLMNKDAIVFALANPVPEISKEEASKASNIAIYANGRSDCKNQINNSLAFPGIISGMVEVRATRFIKATLPKIAQFIAEYQKDRLLPDMFDENFHKQLSQYVKKLYSGMVV